MFVKLAIANRLVSLTIKAAISSDMINCRNMTAGHIFDPRPYKVTAGVVWNVLWVFWCVLLLLHAICSHFSSISTSFKSHTSLSSSSSTSLSPSSLPTLLSKRSASESLCSSRLCLSDVSIVPLDSSVSSALSSLALGLDFFDFYEEEVPAGRVSVASKKTWKKIY